MPTNEENGAYGSLIRSIKRKRRWILALEIISLLIILAFAMPAYVEIMGEVLIDRAGFPLPITLLLILLVALIAIFANAAVFSPVVRAMDEECDPEKHIILCEALLSKTALAPFLAADHTYLGNLAQAAAYADQMIATGKEINLIAGHFNKARCAFLLGDRKTLGEAAEAYVKLGTRKMNEKRRAEYQKIYVVISLMCALADGDKESIRSLCPTLCTWNRSKATEGFLNYLRLLSAHALGDRDEAIYRAKAIKEHLSKTVFARLADELLAKLEEDSN